MKQTASFALHSVSAGENSSLHSISDLSLTLPGLFLIAGIYILVLFGLPHFRARRTALKESTEGLRVLQKLQLGRERVLLIETPGGNALLLISPSGVAIAPQREAQFLESVAPDCGVGQGAFSD